jgi:hypothetical protein
LESIASLGWAGRWSRWKVERRKSGSLHEAAIKLRGLPRRKGSSLDFEDWSQPNSSDRRIISSNAMWQIKVPGIVWEKHRLGVTRQ